MDRSILEAALAGLEAQRARIEQQIEAVRSLMSGPTQRAETEPTTDQTPGRRKGHMSAAGRRAIAEAQRKRWAAKRAEQSARARAAKRGLTAAGRKRLADAMKKRWAAKRTAKAAK
jgi:hypothetical protein